MTTYEAVIEHIKELRPEWYVKSDHHGDYDFYLHSDHGTSSSFIVHGPIVYTTIDTDNNLWLTEAELGQLRELRIDLSDPQSLDKIDIWIRATDN